MTDPFDYGVNYFTNRLGLEPHQARGAVRWMRDVESGLNPGAFNSAGGGRGAFGIGQWRGSRQGNLFQRYGQSPGVEQQFSFAADEMEHGLDAGAARALQRLRSAKTEDEAFRIFGSDFERPGGSAYAKAIGRPEGFYGGRLNVTVRPPGVEFPIDSALDALLSGDPTEGEEADPFEMLDELLGAPQEAAKPAAQDVSIEAPAERRAEPSRVAEPLEQGPQAPIQGLPQAGPEQALDQPLGTQAAAPSPQPAPAPERRDVDVGTGIPLRTGPAENPIPPPTMLDQLLGAAGDIGQAVGGLAERARLGALNVVRLPGSEPLRAKVPVERGLRAAEGALTFATGGLLSPLSTPLRGAAQAARGARSAADVRGVLASEQGATRLPGPRMIVNETDLPPDPGVSRHVFLGWDDASGKPMATGYLLFRENAPGVGYLESVSSIGGSGVARHGQTVIGGEANALGPRAVRTMARQIFDEFPEINRIEGFRMSGARGTPDTLSVTREQIGSAAPSRGTGGAGRPPPPPTPPPPAAGGAVPPSPPPSGASGLVQSLRDTWNAAVRDLQMKVTPMAAGEDAGRAVAKDYAISERKARFWRSEFDTKLRKLSAADQKNMWEAMDRASVEAQTIGGRAGIEAGMRHIHALPDAQQKILMDMERRGIQLWEQARDVGMVAEGAERLPFYVMRGIVEVADEGVSRLASRAAAGQGLTNVDQFGVNLTTRGPMSRGFLTAEQTEAAAKKLSENAEIVRNIRVLPMAYERFEKAIAGRRLINDLKEIGEATGKPTVSEGVALGDQWFTVPHPAFNSYRPRMRLSNETGRVEPLRDLETGKVVMDKVPLYVSREFEGPMRSIMRSETGWWYNASMQLKGAAMATIMNSPVIHNAVEYGRALGAMPGRVGSFRIYFIGNQVRKNPQLMEKAIGDGLVPIGQRGYMQDIEGIATGMDLAPGRGLLAKGAGALTDVVSPQAGQAVRRGIDRAGDFWHQTLLWDRVADLQAGLYNEFMKDLIKKGIDRDTASKMAAHFANRFAGAVPNEAMSEGAKKLLNFVLFSRSFTTGNLGVMKDMLTGLPRDVQAQLGRNLTELEKKAAGSIARRKAIATVMVDIGLMYLSNAILQNGIEMLRDDKSLDDIGHDYAERMSDVLSRTQENPLDLLDPYSDIGPRTVSPLSTNEPGKEERVRLGYRDDGTAVYIRSPVGKIGEEFEGWATRPLEMFRNKEGTMVRPLLNVLENNRGFGGRVEQVYNRNPNSLGEAARAVGSILWEFMRSQTPELQLKAGARMLSGKGDWVDMAQALAPFAGFTISRGAPGGEAVGEMYAAKGEHGDRVKAALPEIRELVRDQKYDEAQQKLQDLNVPLRLQRYYMRVYGTPEARLSPRAMRDFNRYATPEQQRRMEMQMQRRDQRELRSPAAGP